MNQKPRIYPGYSQSLNNGPWQIIWFMDGPNIHKEFPSLDAAMDFVYPKRRVAIEWMISGTNIVDKLRAI